MEMTKNGQDVSLKLSRLFGVNFYQSQLLKLNKPRELRVLITSQIVCLSHGSVRQSLIVRWVLQLQIQLADSTGGWLLPIETVIGFLLAGFFISLTPSSMSSAIAETASAWRVVFTGAPLTVMYIASPKVSNCNQNMISWISVNHHLRGSIVGRLGLTSSFEFKLPWPLARIICFLLESRVHLFGQPRVNRQLARLRLVGTLVLFSDIFFCSLPMLSQCFSDLKGYCE